MNKSEVIAALAEGREKFLQAIEGLPEGAMLEPGVVEEWSVKDVLAHLAAWEAELVTLLAQARQGQKPRYAGITPAQIDELNAKWYEENKSRPLERELADFHGVRKQTGRQVEALADKDLTDPKRYAWLRDAPLYEWIGTYSFEHEAEHAAQIQQWRAKRGV